MDRGTGPRASACRTMTEKPERAGPLLGRLRRQLRRPRQEDRARHRQAPQARGRRLRHPRPGRDLHRRPGAARGQRVPLRACSPSRTRRRSTATRSRAASRQIVTTCPHCFNTLKNEYPDFGAQVRGRAPHRLPARPRRREEARAAQDGRGARSSTTTAATSAATTACTSRRARSSRASPASSSSRPSTGTKQQRPLLRRRRRADVDGGAEQGPREREAHAPAPRHGGEDDRERRARSA